MRHKPPKRGGQGPFYRPDVVRAAVAGGPVVGPTGSPRPNTSVSTVPGRTSTAVVRRRQHPSLHVGWRCVQPALFTTYISLSYLANLQLLAAGIDSRDGT
jgi:hypothetical protein